MTNSPFQIGAGVRGKKESGNFSSLLLLTLQLLYRVPSDFSLLPKKARKNTETGSNLGEM